jgi:hypothetical protein
MKKRIIKLVTVTAMVLALTFGMYSTVFADFVYDYDQVFPESGYYYLTNYKTGEYMYYDKEATWKYIKCGDEDDADIWYIHGGMSNGYEIALAKDTNYILHFDGDANEDSELKIKPSSKMGDHLWTFHAWHDKYAAVHWFIAKVDDGITHPDFNHTYLLHYETPLMAYDYVKLKRHSSDYGDYLYNGEVWYGIKTTYKRAIRSIKPTLSLAKLSKQDRITIAKKIIKNKDLWKRIKKIEIQYSTDKKFKKNVKTKVISKNTGKINGKKLKKGKTYYVRIRFTDGKNVKTKWSKTVKFKKKK